VPALPELDEAMAYLSGAFRRAEPIEEDADATRLARVFVTGNDRLLPEEQVDIYRRQYWLRHVDSLLEDYPGLAHLLGEDGFEAFAKAYLAAHPPEHPSLRDLGHAIVPFSRGSAFPEALREVCLDMLRYEHAFIDLFDGPEPPALTQEKLASIPEGAWDTARIVLHPLLARLAVAYPVHDIRRAAKAGEADVAVEAKACRLVLYRREGLVHCDELDPTPFELLDRLARGESLVVACGALAERLDAEGQAKLEADVGRWFPAWTASKWIVDVELRSP
jgi:Putative DNA-binding domain